MARLGAGDLNHRLRFQSPPNAGTDAYGNPSGEWTEQFTVWAALRLRPGSEAMIAAKLEGRQPVEAIVRASEQTRQITTDWRAIGQAGTVYNIRAASPDPVTRAWVFLMLEAGVAV